LLLCHYSKQWHGEQTPRFSLQATYKYNDKIFHERKSPEPPYPETFRTVCCELQDQISVKIPHCVVKQYDTVYMHIYNVHIQCSDRI